MMGKIKVVAGVIVVIALGTIILVAFGYPIINFIKQLTQTGNHQVQYRITSIDYESAYITLLNGSGNDDYFYQGLPFSKTYTMQDGDRVKIMANAGGTGTLYCHIDLDTTVNWQYSYSSGENAVVTCEGIISQK